MKRVLSLSIVSLLAVQTAALRAHGETDEAGAGNVQTLDTCLSATLSWPYPKHEDYITGFRVRLSTKQNLSDPLVDAVLPAQTEYRVAVVPDTEYYWSAVPIDTKGERPELQHAAAFRTGAPRVDTTAPDAVRYENPRAGAHFAMMDPLQFCQSEPLSPWFSKKAYAGEAAPQFEELKGKLPTPILEGHDSAIDAYWYSWKTLMHVWFYPPVEDDHQAVANMCGMRSWGPWGSSMVWDSAFMMYFAKYGHHAYPFITQFDNCYARQHENGFICREADKSNREVYVVFPLNPPLFAWAEWEYYLVTNDKERLNQVLLPIVKHYEWWLAYQRRDNGLYWTDPFQEADDSPRNQLVHYAASATSYQALTAKCIASIAKAIGRNDLEAFFLDQYAELSRMVNDTFWDEAHGIYNDQTEDGRFITELQPGELCKHAHMFWPLLAGIAPEDRVNSLVEELRNPESFYRRNGVPSLSADSRFYEGGPEGMGHYWRGSVWPPVQCMVQTGLEVSGRRDVAKEFAEKYWQAVIEVYEETGDITEYLAPDQPKAGGVGQFVGWGGIAPIANLIEYVLGLEIDAPGNAITWHINRTERHGLQNFHLGDNRVSVVCEGRSSPDAPAAVTVEAEAPFQLHVVLHGRTHDIEVPDGTHEYTFE